MSSTTISLLLALAAQHSATVYGFGERRCGDSNLPAQRCDNTAITASGIQFAPDVPMAAVPAPTRLRLRPQLIGIVSYSGHCVPVLLADKKNPRYIATGGLDLSPAAVFLVTGKLATKHWQGRIQLCSDYYSQHSLYSIQHTP